MKLSPFCLYQNVVMFQKATCQKAFQRCSSSCKLPNEGRLIPRFHDTVSVGREQHALQPLALVVVSVRGFRAVAHARAYNTIAFVYFSARNLTLLVPISSTNRPPCRKKSILAEVCFDAKRG